VNTKEKIIGISYVFLLVIIVTASFLKILKLDFPASLLKIFGIILLLFGVLLLSWAYKHIGSGIWGSYTPKLEKLVKDGPYKFIRHPVYLSTISILLGFIFLNKSLLALLIFIFVYLPLLSYRLKLEEKTLHETFKKEWEEWKKETDLIFPFKLFKKLLP